ncbi:FadD3 family acyl-CoA ligase [Amycolatopsis sp. 195334CR]|uniref:FadD3 family acyl-CoA ligase n=1 Tax=Amycolatopsis sp. 195334CR TaxID=2814588 RepID=UPI001A9042B2|nr:FadD3 family acyl-CoA ligase [Amycolatopsis sp. 195334CR]MBN6041434.1 AMP-binding protein [Amycolatopsis sp. 195334CR]
MNTSDTIPAALAATAARLPHGEALVDGPARLSWPELHEQVLGRAAWFAERGVHRGDRVAICAPNTHQWVIAALGALTAGAVLVPINTRFTGPEMRDVITRSRAKALVVADDFLGVDRLAQIGDAAPGVVLRLPTDWTDVPGTFDPVVEPDDLADILFTSGTTGRSKGAMTSHRRSLGVAAAWAERAALTADDRYLVLNPFFHTFGYKAGILAAVLRGSTIVPQATFDPVRTMELIEAERITVLPGAPTVFQVLLDHPDRPAHDLSSLRIAVTGAAIVPVPLIERMQTDLGLDTVLTAYGLTEAVVATMCHAGDDPVTVATTCGPGVAGFEVRIAESGEVLLRGPNTMLGYLDDPEATAEAIDADGWLHTGDAGELDERGYLRITDRIKDMYICGGFNVYPAEVEQVLARLDGVTESAVIGVPDARLGEVGAAFVVRSGSGSALSEEDVLAHCTANLANYKRPRRVEFVDALPRNASGKVLKRTLRVDGEEAP